MLSTLQEHTSTAGKVVQLLNVDKETEAMLMVVKDRLPGEGKDHRFRRKGKKDLQFTCAWVTAH